MDVTRNIVWNCTGRIGWSAYKELPIKEFADVKNRFFIRMQVSNEPGSTGSNRESIRRS